MTFEYEVKAPNVIHLLLGGTRREIRLDKLVCEMFSENEPVAVEFKLSTDHKDIFIPKYPVVIYVSPIVGFSEKGIWAIMDMVVQEIVNILQIGQSRLEAFTLSYDEHLVGYTVQPPPDIVRLPDELGVFTKARIRLKFVPTALDIDNYRLTVQAQRRSYPDSVVFEAQVKENPSTHPLKLGYNGTLVAIGSKSG